MISSAIITPTTERQQRLSNLHSGFTPSLLTEDRWLWKLPTYAITTASDTEYVQRPDFPNTMITTQLAFSVEPADCLVYEHPQLGLGILPTWNTKAIISTALNLSETPEADSVNGYLLWENLSFFAPADVLAGLFNDFELCRYIQRYCKQDARIRVDTDDRRHPNVLPLPIYYDLNGLCVQLVLKVLDLGKLATGGLEKTVLSFGGTMLAKGLMDNYKHNMLEPYQDSKLLPEFIEYSKDDACQLFFLREANKERLRLLYGMHSLPVPDREIVTTGALVADLFQSYLTEYIGEHKVYEMFTKANGKQFALEDLLTKATVDYFAERKDSNRAALALVQGGRAKNELPEVISLQEPVADIDLSGAYVSIQRQLTYPVGLPTVYGQHESSKQKLTLGDWLKKNKTDLSPRRWVAVVSGKLQHRQTLVPSKVAEAIEISEDYDPENPKIPADFRLYTNEIINGVITSDVLEVLENCCSNLEWKEWMSLEVIAAAWYPESLRCNTPEEWQAKTQAHVNKCGNAIDTITKRDGTELIKDNRSRYWLAVSIDNFLAPYADERKRLKSARGSFAKGSPEYAKLDAQQDAMKLVGNTLYGVLASPYFPVGNVVVANVITAAARVAVWCTAVALGCVQTITDGGAYPLNRVRDWKNNKPSLNTIALLRSPHLLNDKQKYSLFTYPIGKSPWTLTKGKVVKSDEGEDCYSLADNGLQQVEAKEGGWQVFDQLALEHVRHFFRPTGRKPPITLFDFIGYEHKDLYASAVFASQTNYQFATVHGQVKTKARGDKVKGKPYVGIGGEPEAAMIHQFFADLSQQPAAIPPYPPQKISTILKCNQANKMLTSKTSNVLKENNLLAGDSYYKQKWIRPLTLSPFHWQTNAQYESWRKGHEKLKEKTGWGLEQFFLNSDGTVNYQQALSTIQRKIDAGENWIEPTGGKGKSKIDVETASKHPHYQKSSKVD